MDVPLKCKCGKLSGVATDLSAAKFRRATCYCDDCQSFAHHLGAADELLDEHGGTDVLQVAPARVRITDGREQLKCLRFSPRGLLRLYAGCCNTPVGNAIDKPRVPMIGLVGAFIDHDATGKTPDALLGPPHGRVHGRFAKGGVPDGADSKASFGVLYRSITFLAGGFLRGEHRPSPLFDETGKLKVTPEVISVEQRKQLLKKVAEWAQ